MTRNELIFLHDLIKQGIEQGRDGDIEYAALTILDRELDRLTWNPRTQADIGDENENTTARY